MLNMANNQLTGTLPPAFGSSLRNLRELDLSGNPLQVLLLFWFHLRLALRDGMQQGKPLVLLMRGGELSLTACPLLACGETPDCRNMKCLQSLRHA